MKLHKPTEPFIINQHFGANANSYYSESGYKGHTGTDCFCTFGQVITSACDGYVYSTMNKDNSDLNRYRAVFVLYDDGTDCYEISYGHAKDILVKKGQSVIVGDPLITGGNTGDVASGGRKITLAEKLAGSTAGTHLHFQIRKVEKVKELKPEDWRLSNDEGALFHNGFYYRIIDRDNGYAGCSDPEPFMDLKFVFTQTLKYGSRGEEVKQLQKFFGITQDGIFGNITKRVVVAWQLSHGLVGDGIVGKLTRATLNK